MPDDTRPEWTDEDSGLGLLPKIAIGALAVFGAISLVSWVVGQLLGLVKLILFVVVVGALVAWAITAKSER